MASSTIPSDTKDLVHELFLSEQKEQLAIRTVCDTDIWTDDFDEDRYINYHIGPITAEWLKSCIVFTPNTIKYKRVYEPRVIDLLLHIDPNMLITLQKIFFVADESDIKTVCKIANADPDEFPSTIDFDENDTLGCHWWAYSSIILNLAAIEKTVNEMEQEAKANEEYFNTAQEKAIGVFTTLTHEVRHLGLSNPFLDAKAYPPSLASEKAVEDWGINAYEKWLYHTH